MSSTPNPLTPVLYEVAMAIDAGLELAGMLRQSLSVLLPKLDCAATGIYQLGPTPEGLGFTFRFAMPMHAERLPAYRQSIAQLPVLCREADLQQMDQSLPISGQTEGGGFFYLLSLPGFGVLVLLKYDQPLETSTIRGLKPLLAKLAQACLTCQQAERLTESEARWHFALEGAGDGVWDWNVQTGEVFYSRRWKAMLGYEDEEIGGTVNEWHERVQPEDRPLVDAAMREHLAGVTSSYVCEHRVRCKNGGYKWILDRGKVISRTGDGKPLRFIGIHTDITDRKRVERERLDIQRQLLHAQKLESLGLLAGGIAHDFNNLLMAILGNLDLALTELSSPALVRESIEESLSAARRAADLTRQILAYSGKGRFVVRLLDLSRLVEENVPLLNTLVSKKATLIVHLAPELPLFEADASQIQQIIMNLVANASEALDDHEGTITVSTRLELGSEVSLRQSRIEEKPSPGSFVCLEVRDTGCGMEEATVQRMFEPFYTTKFTGRGLGLAAVLGIVRSHQGAIFVESKKGIGSSIKLYFPVAEKGPALPALTVPGLVPEAGVSTETGKRPTVLVIDDEEMVCRVCQRMVQHLGFQVLTARDGQEGVRTFAERPDQIDCVIVDLSMPKMDGVATFGAIRAIRNQVRVILSSGYNEQEATRRFPGQGLAGFIQKPYTMSNLKAALRQALAGSNHRTG